MLFLNYLFPYRMHFRILNLTLASGQSQYVEQKKAKFSINLTSNQTSEATFVDRILNIHTFNIIRMCYIYYLV